MLKQKNKYIKITIFLMLFNHSGHAELVPDDIETKVIGAQIEKDSQLGYRTIPNSKSQIFRYEKGILVSKTVSTTGANGLRISSSSNKPNKKKHFILLGGSVTFGDGLDDEETISHWINAKSVDYEAYPVGYLGYQVPHTWLQLKDKKMPELIPQKVGKAIIYINAGAVLGVAGHSSQLHVISSWPVIQPNENGQLQFIGIFENVTNLLNRVLLKWCLPIAGCKSALQRKTNLTEDQFKQTLTLVEDIEKMYRQQFQVEDFQIAWGDSSPKDLKLISSLTKIPVFYWPKFDKAEEGNHPTAIGAKKMAEFLFEKKIVN